MNSIDLPRRIKMKMNTVALVPIPIRMPTVLWKTCPPNMLSIKNLSILMTSDSVNFLKESVVCYKTRFVPSRDKVFSFFMKHQHYTIK